MSTISPGFEKQITEELILKVASTEEEGNRLAKFNALIHGEELEPYVKRLYFEHPHREDMLWFYIEEVTESQIVSSLTLLPLTWEAEETAFPIAEMGFVGTLESHRGQGLFGILNDYYEAALEERKLVISALVGIPNFYRKFGYVFALNRYSGYSIPTDNIPQAEVEDVKVRKASPSDLDHIRKFYEATNKNYVFSTDFDKEKLQFRLLNDTADIFNSVTYIVEQDRKPQGFFAIGALSDPDQADIILVSELTYRQMLKVLQFVKTYNLGTILSFKVNVHRTSSFAEYLQSIGGSLENDWPWQVMIPDIHRFFNSITPALEHRIKNSMFRGLNKVVKISNYADTIALHFEEGKIKDITIQREFPDDTVDLRIPKPHHNRLFLSDRSVDEIKHIINDTIVKKESELLIKTLFPTKPSIPFSYYE